MCLLVSPSPLKDGRSDEKEDEKTERKKEKKEGKEEKQGNTKSDGARHPSEKRLTEQ